MKNALIFFSILFGLKMSVTAQITANYYIPGVSQIKQLHVDSLTCTNFWTEKKKRKTETRIDHVDRYIFTESGRTAQYLLISEKDNHILEKWNYTYDLNDSLLLFTRSHFGEPDKISLHRESTYTPLSNGWIRLTVIDSSMIGYEGYQPALIRSEKFILKENGTLISDSTITQHCDFSARTVVKNYFHYTNGSQDYTVHKTISNEITRTWQKLYEYDEKGRITAVYSVQITEAGTEKELKEKWDWDDKKHELKIYSDNLVHGGKQVEYFRYDEKNQLIEYSNDLNDAILRMYEMSYYDNGLLKRLVTIAPKDNWTHTKEYVYSFGEAQE